jgi:hypothetical protein
VLKMFIWGKYYYHLFQHHHNKILQKECLCEELRMELKVKATYHNSKAVELGSKM